jgi:hypothetical protein|tara:strand:- start:110 stop:220 length:111 start_codon:yes stop_codon:yes gene_type:complete
MAMHLVDLKELQKADLKEMNSALTMVDYWATTMGKY